MKAWDAKVQPTETSRFPQDVTFRLGTHANTVLDVRLTLQEDVLIDMAGTRVKTERRADLNIPDRWPGDR
jgi:hypothetical protein